MTRDIIRRVAALAAVVIAGLSTIATSQGVPAAFTDSTFSVSLSPEHPLDMRRIGVRVAHSGNAPSSIELRVGTAEPDTSWRGYRLSLVPDDPFEPSLQPLGGDYGDGTSTSISILESCESDCDRTYTLVSRLVDPDGQPVAPELSAHLMATYDASSMQTPFRATTELVIGTDEAATRGFATVRGVVTGRATIGPDRLHEAWSGLLHVPAAALLPADDGRTMGGFWLTLGASPTDERARAHVAVRLDDRAAYVRDGYFDSSSNRDVWAFEWLSGCEPGAACIVPVVVEFKWEPWKDSAGKIPLSGSVTLDWSLEATIEYLDASTPPSGATLELAPEQ